MPRRRARRRDLVDADGLTVVPVLGISERAEDDALLGGHVLTNLAPSVRARNRGPPTIAARSPAPGRSSLRRMSSCGS